MICKDRFVQVRAGCPPQKVCRAKLHLLLDAVGEITGQRKARMKTLISTIALSFVCNSTFAQGTLNFANAGVGLTAKVTGTDGVGLVGSAWSADLFWAPGVVTDSRLLAELGQPASFSTVPSQAGFFFGGLARTVPTSPGVITAQVRVWDTASGGTWPFAQQNPIALLGESILFQVTLADPNATPPGIPPTMTGLNGHPFVVGLIPEPSTYALGGLGLAGLLFRHRKVKN